MGRRGGGRGGRRGRRGGGGRSAPNHWSKELALIPSASNRFQIIFPWDSETKQYTFRDWDESKLEGKISKQDIIDLFEELKKTPNYRAEAYCGYWAWAWIFIILPPVFGLLILCSFIPIWNNQSRVLRKQEFDPIVNLWNQKFTEQGIVMIVSPGHCATWLELQLIFAMKT